MNVSKPKVSYRVSSASSPAGSQFYLHFGARCPVSILAMSIMIHQCLVYIEKKLNLCLVERRVRGYVPLGASTFPTPCLSGILNGRPNQNRKFGKLCRSKSCGS